MHPIQSLARTKRGFTLVELLVVITIIGILAGLLLVGVNAALKAARRTQIQTEINNLHTAFEEFRQSKNAFPPNCMNMDINGVNGNLALIQHADLVRFMKSAFPRHREPSELLESLVNGNLMAPNNQRYGMRADEAIVFWLGGFSDDPQYPISQKGGPAYPNTFGPAEPLDERSFIFEFDRTRLGPRDPETGLFTGRFVVYQSPIIDNDSTNDVLRINLWTYTPPNKKQPFLYFDTSRHAPVSYDNNGNPIYYDPVSKSNNMFAIKQIDQASGNLIQFANPGSFQILSAGLDDEWGNFANNGTPIYYPTGPFTGEIADTQVNFSQKPLEDSEE